MHEQSSIGEATESNLPSKLSLSILISATSAYSVAIGMAYLWGYWAPFSINILDYMGLSDILTATAWPLISSFSAILVGMLMSTGSTVGQSPRSGDSFGRFLLWYWRNLRELHFLGLFLIWASSMPFKWYLLALFGGIPLTVYLLNQRWMDYFPVSRGIKLMVIFFVICAPAAAISTGQQRSRELLEGLTFQVVYSDIEGFSVPADAKPEARPRLIGQRSDTLFMWDPQLKRTIITKFPTGRPLVIGKFNAASTLISWEQIVGWLKKLFI